MSEFDVYDEAAMKERYNLTPKQFIDLKGLMGDKSDNIPGVPGIGEKKGIALLEQYGSIENVLDHADEIKGKMGENIRANADSARMSKWLATIKTDTPVEFTWDQLRFTSPDIDKLIEVYTELEFNSFIRKLQSEGTVTEEQAVSAGTDLSSEFAEINVVDAEKFLKDTEEGALIFADAVTDSSHLRQPDFTGIALYDPASNTGCAVSFTPMDTDLWLSRILAKNYRLCG
jgi:DNA polymerase-1